MRTMMHWAVKSQQAFTVNWTNSLRFNIGCKSIRSRRGSELIRICATDDENDILTDKLVTYSKCEY